jgi:NADPH-dependent 7-cyano-7-deazaguanine reductase QueF-like protein
LLIVFSLFIFTGCFSTNEPQISSSSATILIKTLQMKFYDKGFVYKFKDYTQVQIFSAGTAILDMKIYDDKICRTTFKCQDLESFNKENLASRGVYSQVLEKDKSRVTRAKLSRVTNMRNYKEDLKKYLDTVKENNKHYKKYTQWLKEKYTIDIKVAKVSFRNQYIKAMMDKSFKSYNRYKLTFLKNLNIVQFHLYTKLLNKHINHHICPTILRNMELIIQIVHFLLEQLVNQDIP